MERERGAETVRGLFHGCLNTASYRCRPVVGRSESEAAASNRGLQNPLPAKFGRRRQRSDLNLSRPLTRPSAVLGATFRVQTRTSGLDGPTEFGYNPFLGLLVLAGAEALGVGARDEQAWFKED